MKRKFVCYGIGSDKNKKTIYEVEIGHDYFFDKNGLKEQLEPVLFNGKILTTSGWPFYETDYGHCGLCGGIKCNGTCQGGV